MGVVMMLLSFSSGADEPASSNAEQVWEAAGRVRLVGPTDIALVDQATLHLPTGYAYVPHDESVAVMNLMGNSVGPDFIGLIFPEDEANWFASLRFVDEGYIEDGDAQEWDIDDLMNGLKAGTQEGNKFREQQGVPPIEITGWIEQPSYEANNHRLIWSVGIKDQGVPARSDDGVNYNTYVLGREGYISLNLITSQDVIEVEKPIAKELLAAIEFNDGHRYADFDSSTDKVAAYGLAALVGGAALKKVGLFAVIAAFFAKFFKLIILGGIAVVMPLLKKVFKRG